MRPEVTLGVDALAVCRLTRLVTKDEIAQPFRDRWIRGAYRLAGLRMAPDADPEVVLTNDEDPPKLAYLITCPWCTGTWCGLLVVGLRRFTPRFWDPIARALAFSQGAGYIADLDVD